MGDDTTATDGPDGPDGPEELSTAMRTAIARLYRRFRSERQSGELGDAALSVLTSLRKHGPLSLTELSDHARVTPGSMSQTVNRLTTGGYAVRTPDPADGRRVLFSPTVEGRRIAAETLERSVGWLDSRLATLTEDERETLARASALMVRIAG